MKSVKNSLLAVTIILLTLNGCKKDNPVSTSLTIRLIDEQGSLISGVAVKLYKTIDDMEIDTNQVGLTLTTDASGEVTFSELETIKYYWFAEKGCKNNVNGISNSSTLELNKTLIITATLIETGSLDLTNQSTSQYQVFINGSLLLTADPQFIYSYIYVPAGSYSIKVVQVGGSINKTYTGTITCGTKFSVVFP